MNPTMEVVAVVHPDKALLRTAAPALVRLRAQGYREFPPAELDRHFSTDEGQLVVYGDWITAMDPAPVAQVVVVAGDTVVGHVAVCTPHAYLASVAVGTCLEVSRLFVDPQFQGHGIGRMLLAEAVTEIRSRGARPVLAVLEESVAARSMYRAHGWVERDLFDGLQGINLLMVHEVVEPPPLPVHLVNDERSRP